MCGGEGGQDEAHLKDGEVCGCGDFASGGGRVVDLIWGGTVKDDNPVFVFLSMTGGPHRGTHDDNVTNYHHYM